MHEGAHHVSAFGRAHARHGSGAIYKGALDLKARARSSLNRGNSSQASWKDQTIGHRRDLPARWGLRQVVGDEELAAGRDLSRALSGPR